MTTGNKSQAIVLSIVALGAIGFLGKTVLGGGSGKLSLAHSARTAKPSSNFHLSMLDSSLTVDPFSSPKLATKAADRAIPSDVTASKEPRAHRDTSAEFAPMPLSGPVALPGTLIEHPEGNTGNHRSQDRAVLTVRLNATLRVEQQLAVISIGSEEAREYRAGSTIAPGISIVAIGDDRVTFSAHGIKKSIAVGEDAQL